jgi:hypothetical protein
MAGAVAAYNIDRHDIHGCDAATQEAETDMSNSGTYIGVAPVCLEVNTKCVITTFSTQTV